MNTKRMTSEDVPQTGYREPPLLGWQLVLTWITLFATGWAVALALFGAVYWLIQ